MSVSRVKTLLIAALVFLNAFFLFFVLADKAGAAVENRRIAEGLVFAYEQSGIAVECDLRTGETPRLYHTTRDLFAESKAADAALGGCEPVSLPGGGISRYEGAYGTAQFNTLGEFNIEYTDGYPSATGAEPTAERLLRSMKINADDFTVTGDFGSETVTATARYRGDAVINCRVTFEFSGGKLLRVSGRWAFGVTEYTEEQSFYDLQTLMMTLLASVRRGETTLTELTSVTSAYRFTSGAGGDGELSPGWLIRGDGGDWFADALTGRLEPVGDTAAMIAAFSALG